MSILDGWSYEESFYPPVFHASAELRERQDELLKNDIAAHPFFAAASTHRGLLKLWAGQEAVVTGPFSQLLLRLAAAIPNVHDRAALLTVIDGEHGPVDDSMVASESHPFLLHRLCASLGLRPSAVRPLEPTIQFLAVLEDCTASVLGGLGALSVGSEALLLPEYGAIRGCFEVAAPEADYAAFIDANLDDDARHASDLLALAARLATSPNLVREWADGAKRAVDARFSYYDELLALGEVAG